MEKKFGEAIRADVTEILNQYKIPGANVLVNDLGALGFAVRARVETAVKRALAREVK